MTTDEPTEKGLHREACCFENYSESETANVVSLYGNLGGAQSRRFTRGGYLGLATTGSEEWYTPSSIFAALGCRFDLDVASPGADIVPWIPADRHYTLSDNGLENDWGGAFVWCNPPYSREGLRQWTEKFSQRGNGIAMIGDRTSSGVWQDLCAKADLILLVNKKINFISPSSGPGNNTLGSTLVAYGERGVQALRHAAAAGLGTLFKPCQPVGTRAEDVDAYMTAPSTAHTMKSKIAEEDAPPDAPMLGASRFMSMPSLLSRGICRSMLPVPAQPPDEPEARYIHYEDPYHSFGGGVRICTNPQTKRFIANVQVPLDFDLAAHLRAIFGSEADR